MDLITNIEKLRGKMRVVINDETVILVPISLFRERPLNSGDEIDLPEYDQWLMLRQYRHALDRAVVFLTARARSIKEVERKLLQCGYLPSTVEMVLLKLQSMNILNDEDFASQWVEARSNKHLGKRRIHQELLNKGVNKKLAEETLEKLDESAQAEQALELAARLSSRYAKDEPRKAVQKLIQALVRRGFNWDTAKEAAFKALQTDDFDA